jgi:ribonuclease G
MRLRDLGGIIIIDFIDMKLPDNKKQVYDALEKFMANDRARHTILPISKFGLLQITRQRLRPELNITTAEVCPGCNGTGKIGPSILVVDEIENDLKYLINQGHRELTIHVNPILASHLTKGNWFNKSILKKWIAAHKVKLNLVVDNNSPITHYQFYDSKTDDLIKL